MNGRSTKDEEALRRLEDALIGDIGATSDDEILAEAKEDGIDPTAAAQHTLSLLRAAEVRVGKAKLAAAKAGVVAVRNLSSAHNSACFNRGKVLPKPANDPASRLTLAARNAGQQSDRDLETLAEDLAELEAIHAKRDEGQT
jgi:hypothetical protein